MSYVWDLSGTDKQCELYGPGHQIHWIHFNHSMREPSVVIPVTAVVDDYGARRSTLMDVAVGVLDADEPSAAIDAVKTREQNRRSAPSGRDSNQNVT